MRTHIVIGIAATALLLAGCGSSGDSSSPDTTTAAATTVATTAPAGENTITVELGDETGTSGPMTMVLSAPTATAGKVTFVVKNTGTIEHEMVVLKTDTPYDQLPVGSDDKVSEDTSIGEASEMKPGETQTVVLDMPAGSYALVCNIAKHYAMGMRAAFTTAA